MSKNETPPRHSKSKFLQSKDQQNLEGREKQHVSHKEAITGATADFSSEPSEARGQWGDVNPCGFYQGKHFRGDIEMNIPSCDSGKINGG